MSTKTLRFEQFSSISPDEKVVRWCENFRADFRHSVSRFKRYIREYHQGFSELDWGHAREPLSFDDEELRILETLIFQYRTDPCLCFARTPQNEGDDRLPQNTGEVLLKLMRKYYGLVFGYKDPATSKFIEGVMARVQGITTRVDEIDWWLCSNDFRGKTMFDLLEELHNAGYKEASQDFLEQRIARLMTKGGFRLSGTDLGNPVPTSA